MKQVSFRSFVQAGAKWILKDIAHDINLCNRVSFPCPSFWKDAKRIESRFNLAGFTMTWLTWIEWQEKAAKAIRCLNRVRFELDEQDRIASSCAQDDLRDFQNIYGYSPLQRLKSQL